jgi:prophage regulatory protein
LKNQISHRRLRLTEVKNLTGLSKSSIYARIAEGSFLRQIPLVYHTVVWLETDIQNWIAEQVSAVRG